MIDSSGRARNSRSSAILLVSACLVAAGLFLYRPWEPVPLAMTDYSELLPILQGSDGFVDRLGEVVAYYRSQGRSNLLTSALIVLNWESWGSWAVGWRLSRTALMGAGILATLLLLARFRISLTAAAAGATLLVVGRAAAANWLRLTGEPLALLFLAGALIVAADYQRGTEWHVRLGALCLLVAALVLTKEPMIVTVPVVGAVALCRGKGGRLRLPRGRPRDRGLIVALTLATGLLLTVVIWVMLTSGTTGYARGYGAGGIGVQRFAENLSATLLPLPDPGLATAAANLAFVTIVGAGWVWKLRRESARRRELLAGLALILALPVLGAVVYLPWGRFQYFYALPFYLAAVFLLATGVQGLEPLLARRRWLVAGIAVILVAPQTAALAHRIGRFDAALHHVDWKLARALTRFPEADTLFFAVPGLPEQPWQGRGPTLRRFTEAVHGAGGTLPVAKDVTCRAAAQRLSRRPGKQGESLFISYGHGCGPLPEPTVTIREPYSYLRLPGFRPGRDTVRADLRAR